MTPRSSLRGCSERTQLVHARKVLSLLCGAVAVTLDTQPRRKDPRADGRLASAPTTLG
jgi:hypothetical protein